MRVKFYLKGSKRKGTVHVDVKQVSLIINSNNLTILNPLTPSYVTHDQLF